uniref:fibroblast growth factor 6 isoform X1 n=1 Tax=Urocitellus parryii TaxID=9999 RepID=UPI000E55B10C|nr:fibroblast growth factor 6 isoform X1 [Urocitellus parryii]
MALGQRLFITMSRGAGRLQGTLQALVFLGVLVGMVVPSPAGTRANSTLLDSRGWGTLLSRSRAGLAGEIAGVNWESGYLVGIKRQRRLYCNVGIGFHLQVSPDGRISGTHEENPYSLLEISTVERGVVSLFGVKSALFVAMNSKGRLYTTVQGAESWARWGLRWVESSCHGASGAALDFSETLHLWRRDGCNTRPHAFISHGGFCLLLSRPLRKPGVCLQLLPAHPATSLGRY